MTNVRYSKESHTGTAVITIVESDNAIVVIPGANAPVNETDVAQPALTKGDVLVSQFEIPASTVHAFFSRAGSIGATTILNPAPAIDFDRSLLRLVDILVLNESELGFMTRQHLQESDPESSFAEGTEDLDRPLIILYVGDHDPSGMHMSEVDLPDRLERYGGNVDIRRIALAINDIVGPALPSFALETKRNDPRHDWYLRNYGPLCWELDAMSPPVLRERVRAHILNLINCEAWDHCKTVEAAWCNPATWLNQLRWLDQPAAQADAPRSDDSW